MSRLKGTVAILTGAADGIRLAIRQSFAKEEAMVVTSDINKEKCNVESALINSQGGDTTIKIIDDKTS